MTPLERAARAIHDNLPLDSGVDPPDVEMLIDVARAVLTAIREPSDGMIEAATRCEGALGATYPDSEGSFAEGGARKVWQAMIEAALAEEAQ